MPTQYQGFRVVYNDVCKSSSNRPGIGRERNAMSSTVIDRSCYNLRPQYVASNTVSEDRQLADEEDGMESEQHHLLYDDGRCLRRHCTAIAVLAQPRSYCLTHCDHRVGTSLYDCLHGRVVQGDGHIHRVQPMKCVSPTGHLVFSSESVSHSKFRICLEFCRRRESLN